MTSPLGCTEYSVGTVKFDCRLLLPQTRHRNWNTEGLGSDAHPALARSGRERAASTLTLAAGGPKHEAQHSWRRSCALRRDRFYKIGGNILIGIAEIAQLGWPGINHRLPVSFAGANGGTPVIPLTCCVQPVSNMATVVFCDATMAFA
jgi:hypothetical protein